MAIEIVVFPIKNGDFPQLCKRLPECKSYLSHLEFYEKLKIWWREIHGWTWEGKHQHWCPQDRSPQHDHHRRNITVTLSLIHISQTHAFSFSLLDCMPIQVAGNVEICGHFMTHLDDLLAISLRHHCFSNVCNGELSQSGRTYQVSDLCIWLYMLFIWIYS